MAEQRSSARAYGVCIYDDRVLLVRAAKPHEGQALWWLPGGGIDFGESATEAVVREFLEETGIEVGFPHLLDVTSDTRIRDNGDRIHTIRIIYRVTALTFELSHEVDGTTDFAQWVDLRELHNYALAPYARVSIESVLA
ncbi:MAG: NUDIX domain-containing protein [Actinomycetota bacterium]